MSLQPTEAEISYVEDTLLPTLEGMIKQVSGLNAQVLEIREKWESLNLAAANNNLSEAVYWFRKAIAETNKEKHDSDNH